MTQIIVDVVLGGRKRTRTFIGVTSRIVNHEQN